MAKQTINIGTTANDGTGDPLRTAFDKVNDNFTELYSDDAGDVDSVNGQTGVVVLDSDDIAEGSTNEYYTEARVSANTSVAANTAKVTNATHTGDVTGSTALTIASGAVTNAKMAANSIDSDQYVDGSIDTAHFSLTAAINVNVDQNSGTLQLWSGTQAQYDALTPDASTIYFIV